MEKKKIEKEKQHELALGSLEVSYQTEKEKAESDKTHDMEVMEAVLLNKRQEHKAEVEQLMRVMSKRQEEDESKVQALERDHSRALKSVVDNHARQIGKMKKRERSEK